MTSSIFVTSHHSKLLSASSNSSSATMSQFRASYPTTNERGFPVNGISNSVFGNVRECKFYRCANSGKNRALAFCLSYDAAMLSTNHKDLCTYVGSMIRAVSNRDDSVMEALRGVGVQPRFEEPYEHGINEARATEMDWPLIQVYFGCICILLCIKKNSELDYNSFMTSCIRELRNKVGYQPGIQLNVPFDFIRANAIRTMLGACSTLRKDLIQFIIQTFRHGPASLINLCQYLFNALSWSGMDEIILMNEILVIPNSPVLRDPRFSREAMSLAEACAAIQSHPYPQFFMHLASNEELIKVDHSRFPNLIAIAQQMQGAEQNGSAPRNSHQPLLLQW